MEKWKDVTALTYVRKSNGVEWEGIGDDAFKWKMEGNISCGVGAHFFAICASISLDSFFFLFFFLFKEIFHFFSICKIITWY